MHCTRVPALNTLCMLFASSFDWLISIIPLPCYHWLICVVFCLTASKKLRWNIQYRIEIRDITRVDKLHIRANFNKIIYDNSGYLWWSIWIFFPGNAASQKSCRGKVIWKHWWNVVLSSTKTSFQPTVHTQQNTANRRRVIEVNTLQGKIKISSEYHWNLSSEFRF